MFTNLGYVINNVVILIYVLDGCLAENIFVNNSHPSLIRQRRQSCGQSEFQCTDIHQCIPSYKFCDGVEDCRDKTDETSKCSTIDCPPYAYRCAYGACVTGDARCDGIKHCADNSDENGCGNQNPNTNTNSNCRPGQFSCDSGMCIDQFNVCDGKRHCDDGSDETAKQCGSQECPDYGFRCAYGACIDGDSRCNGTIECADGSDEARSICGGPLITTPSTITQSPTENGCRLPPYPQHGTYTVLGSTASLKPGDVVPSFSIMNVSCNSGYRRSSESNVFCSGTQWTTEITCVASGSVSGTKCPPLISSTVIFDCRVSNNQVPCDQEVPDGTVASLKCKEFFEALLPPGYNNFILCRNGKWNREPFTCNPACGQRNPDGQVLVVGGRETKVAEYPWHVGIYRKDPSDNTQICGGSLVKTNIIVTAAHCFYSSTGTKLEDLYAVSAGNYFRKWSHPEDKHVQLSDVEKIHIPPQYTEYSYANDIAVVIIKQSFSMTGWVGVVCVNWQNEIDVRIRHASSLGHVVGWGLTTEGGNPSEVLKTIDLPIIQYQQCRAGVPNSFRKFITDDKFCAGYLNGSSVCEGDSGGGFTIEDNDRYFLEGVVSAGPRKGSSCDAHQYTLYTRILYGDRSLWIKEIISKYEVAL